MRVVKQKTGFGITELLVSLFIFSFVMLSLSSFSNLTFANLGVENRASAAARELKNAMELLSSELRMSSAVSPYLPGDIPATVNCSSQIVATATSIKFLVVHDDSDGDSGIQPYYVGYVYDPAKQQLLRGEIAKLSSTNCTLPAGDPTSSNYARVIADRVYQWDSNKDGSDEPIFQYSSKVLTVNILTKATGSNGTKIDQGITTKIFTRSG